MPKKLTKEEFISKARKKHGNKYDYSKVEYVNAITKVCIICHEKDENGKEHGEFWQTPNKHLAGRGCHKCGGNIKLTTESFIKKVREKHRDKYDYSKVEYVNNHTDVCIICPEHGEFWQMPYNHLIGQGCPKCVGKHKTTESFIEEARKKHGDKYDYSKVEYVNTHTKVCIICHEKDENGKEHGEFWQTPSNHLKGSGCPKCKISKNAEQQRGNKESFIEEARKKHGNKYDYSKVEYVNNHTDVCIICPEHGEFWQMPYNHLIGQGCPKCVGKHKTTESFIEEARKKHGDKYDYSKVEYTGSKTKVCIICHEKDENGKEHGEFWQTPSSHLKGQGCPICNESHLETDIRCFLDIKHIKYVTEKKFKWMGRKRLDFYLPDYNIAIECQGKQHFRPVDFFGGENEFILLKERDEKKKELCEQHNIKVLYYSDLDIDYPYKVYEDMDELWGEIKKAS